MAHDKDAPARPEAAGSGPALPAAAEVGHAVEADLSLTDAESTLVNLASALFPLGLGELAQLTWSLDGSRDPAARASTDGRGGTEPRLRAADLRYRTLVEQIPAVTFLAVLGEGDNEIYVSPYIESLLGFTQQEWLENPFLWYSQLHPDDRALWHDEFARGIRTGGPFRAECRFIARDGHVVWVRGEARLVKDELGRPMFLQGVAFDITESKRTHTRELQEAIRSTEQRYRDLVEQLDAMFWEAEADTGRITFVSGGAEAILGFPRERWISEPDFWISRVHPDDRELVANARAHAAVAGGQHTFEFRAQTAEGRQVWLHARIRSPRPAAGEQFLFGVMLDVTERKRGEEERARLYAAAEDARAAAESANRAKDEFLATMSHELRTPLNALIGYAQLLRADQLPPTLMDHALESIERTAKLQSKLVDDLLDVSRIITGKLHLEVGLVDLAAVVDGATETVRLAANGKRITLASAVDRSGLVVSGDATRLQQVLWNLLSNALKFTPEGGRVEILLERVGSYARIVVKDSGQGISPDFLPYVFERFRQADGSMTRRSGGLGLGLAIVRHLIEMHGGMVTAESAGLGHGATFTARLPLSVAADAASDPSSHGAGHERRPLEQVRILVVDDDADARELLRAVFSQAGAEVTTLNSAAEVVDALKRVQPHVLVSDIGMPDEDGYQLLRRVRASGWHERRLPAVALTAYAGEDHRRRALDAGYQEHVPKPLDLRRIVALVAHLIDVSRGRESR
jgi:PAS domain S-box-containing protein